MAAALLPDRLWDLVEPFLPILPRRPQGGRPRVSDRACLTGIVFVLRSGIPWQMLPQELGCGSGMTCWRRLRDWQEAGVWDLIHFALLDWLARDHQIDWSRAVVDSCCIRAAHLLAVGVESARTVRQDPTTDLEAARRPCLFTLPRRRGSSSEVLLHALRAASAEVRAASSAPNRPADDRGRRRHR